MTMKYEKVDEDIKKQQHTNKLQINLIIYLLSTTLIFVHTIIAITLSYYAKLLNTIITKIMNIFNKFLNTHIILGHYNRPYQCP